MKIKGLKLRKRNKCIYHMETFFHSIKKDKTIYHVRPITEFQCDADSCSNEANFEIRWRTAK